MTAANVSREEVLEALFALVQTAYQWKTTSRKFRLWDDVPKAERPAAFLVEQDHDSFVYQSETLLKRTLRPELWVYTAPEIDEPGGPILNKILDGLEAALAPAAADFVIGRQTLGGIVSHCYIEGDVVKHPGDLDNDGLLIVPIVVLMP